MIADIMQILTISGDEIIFQVAKENDKYFIVKNAARISSNYEYTSECSYFFHPLFVDSSNKGIFIYKNSIVSSIPPSATILNNYKTFTESQINENTYCYLNDVGEPIIDGKIDQAENVMELQEQNAVLQAMITNIGNNIKFSNVYVDSDGEPHYLLDKNKLH